MWPVRLLKKPPEQEDEHLAQRDEAQCQDARMFTGLDFWNAPDRWDGIENPNLRSPNGQAFWMIERQVKKYISPPPRRPSKRDDMRVYEIAIGLDRVVTLATEEMPIGL